MVAVLSSGVVFQVSASLYKFLRSRADRQKRDVLKAAEQVKQDQVQGPFVREAMSLGNTEKMLQMLEQVNIGLNRQIAQDRENYERSLRLKEAENDRLRETVRMQDIKIDAQDERIDALEEELRAAEENLSRCHRILAQLRAENEAPGLQSDAVDG